MQQTFGPFTIRPWQPRDRDPAAALIASVLAEYGLAWEPTGADQDVIQVETAYWQGGGEFWVIETEGTLVGTGAFYPIDRGQNAVELRKMYIALGYRGQGLGKFLLQQLEGAIAARGFTEIWIETASVLQEAVCLYERNGYQPATGVETARCDRVYRKVLDTPPSSSSAQAD